MPKDDILTIQVSGSNLVFTRYLYIKDEVKNALLVSILNKSDDAIFWAYELYYSGYKNELFSFIWKIYYDFFATLNPNFAAYLTKKIKKDFNDDRFVSSIIQNLLIRPFNTDIFMMRTICELFEAESTCTEEKTVETFLNEEDYRGLGYYILNNKEKEIDIYKNVLNYFNLTNQQKLLKDFLSEIENDMKVVSNKIILLSNIMSKVTLHKGQIKGKNFYVRVDPEEVVQYETIESSQEIKPYRIMRMACIYNIDNFGWQNLFQSFRNKVFKKELKETYNGWCDRAIKEKHSDNWLYHAAFSPTWFDRIKKYKGFVDYENNRVKFISQEWEEAFYSTFDLEPDEQPQNIKENIHGKTTVKKTWQQFFASFKKNSLINIDQDEIEELNTEPLKY